MPINVVTVNVNGVRAAFRKHVTDRLPPDAKVSFKEHGGSPAISVPTDGPFLRKAVKALGDEWGREAALIGPRINPFDPLLRRPSQVFGQG